MKVLHPSLGLRWFHKLADGEDREVRVRILFTHVYDAYKKTYDDEQKANTNSIHPRPDGARCKQPRTGFKPCSSGNMSRQVRSRTYMHLVVESLETTQSQIQHNGLKLPSAATK